MHTQQGGGGSIKADWCCWALVKSEDDLETSWLKTRHAFHHWSQTSGLSNGLWVGFQVVFEPFEVSPSANSVFVPSLVSMHTF